MSRILANQLADAGVT